MRLATNDGVRDGGNNLVAPAMAVAAVEPRLLDRVDQIDIAWLEGVLRASGSPTARVKTFALTPIGSGNVSSTVRVDMTVDDARGACGTPQAMICKFRPLDAVSHAHGVASRAYTCEIGAYSLLSSLLGTCRIPGLIWVAGGAENINLVVEDLTRSTRPGNQIAGCDVADALAVMAEMARLHRSTPLPLEADAADWMLRMPECGEYWGPAIGVGAQVIADRYGDRLSQADIASVREAAELAQIWHRLPLTRASLTHGDPRVDNILFEDRGDGVQAILIDWQVAGRRSPMHDVGYFLSGSVSVEDRRAHEHALIEHYAERLGSRFDYPHDEILADYRIHLVSGLMITTAAAAVLPDTPQAATLLLALLERNLAAVADWGSLAAIRDAL
jgi:thiamine kinase-like enzyme